MANPLKLLLIGITPPATGVAMAPYLIRTYLKNHSQTWRDARVPIRNWYNDAHPQTISDEVLAGDYDIVAFSCYVWNVQKIIKVSQLICMSKPSVSICVGGPEASFRAKAYLEKIKEWDFVVTGEGEITFTHFMDEFARDKSFHKVQGLTYRDAGVVKQNIPRASMDLSLVPSPILEGDIDLNNIGPNMAAFETYRGCVYRCGFCVWGLGGKIRYFPMDRVEQELKAVLRSKIRRVWVSDSIANLNKKRFLRLLTIIQEQNHNDVAFDFEVFAEFLDDELIHKLSLLKRGYIAIGLQTSNEQTLMAAKRRFEREKFRQNVTKLVTQASRLEVFIDVILGLPGDTISDFEASIDFALSLRPSLVNMQLLSILPGSNYASQADQLGIRFQPDAPYLVTQTAQCSELELKTALGWHARLKLYYRPHVQFLVNLLSDSGNNSERELIVKLEDFLEDKGAPISRFAETGLPLNELLIQCELLLHFYDHYGRQSSRNKVFEVLKFLALKSRLKGRHYDQQGESVDGEMDSSKMGIEHVRPGVYEVTFGFPLWKYRDNFSKFVGESVEAKKESMIFNYTHGKLFPIPKWASHAASHATQYRRSD